MLYRRSSYPTAWDEMERLQREMNQFFNVSLSNRPTGSPDFPAINVWSNDEGAVLTAEIPGINPDEIDISVIGQTITIVGKRQPEAVGENAHYHRQERLQGEFARSLELPFAIDAEGVKATFDRGILKITLPRTEAEKPKKILVKTS